MYEITLVDAGRNRYLWRKLFETHQLAPYSDLLLKTTGNQSRGAGLLGIWISWNKRARDFKAFISQELQNFEIN